MKQPLKTIPGINRVFSGILDVTRPFRAWYYEVLPLYMEYTAHKHAVFLVLTPDHGNLGDHAIACAVRAMLESAGAHVVEITYKKLIRLRELNWLKIMNGKRIFINGGGNMGTLWFNVEQMHRNIIMSNPKSDIFIMPNTVCYEDSDWGREEWENSKRIYNSHRHLHIFARERTSYDTMRNAYRSVSLTPDMVLSLNRCKNDRERKGCLICIRSDHERTISREQERAIRLQAEMLFGDCVCDTDTISDCAVPIDRREEALRSKFDQFSGAELVITDRLHGMIFCAITGTPCIVIDSKSPKIRGCYEWIEKLEYVQFVDDVAGIAYAYSEIPKGLHNYDNTQLMPYFDKIRETIADLLVAGRN